MRVGLNLVLWTVKPSREHLGLLEQIHAWGFDGIEFPVQDMEVEDVRILSRRCDELGLGRTCIAALNAQSADPTHPDPKLREAALVALKKCVDLTREFGADLLAGPFHQGLGRFTGRGPTQQDLERSAEVIRRTAEYAATMNVELALEPLNRFEMFLTNTIESAADFATRVGMSNVGILADTHHSNIEEERPAAAWRRAMKHIKHVHISENHRGIPGTGHACTAEIFQTLREEGYDRWLIIEALGLGVPSLISPVHLWRRFFEKEEDAAVQGLGFIRSAWERTRPHPR